MICPLVTSRWVESALWAFVFTFMQVSILWALNFTAMEIESPFGRDSNDVDGASMQHHLNTSLMLLVEQYSDPSPRLSSNFELPEETMLAQDTCDKDLSTSPR